MIPACVGMNQIDLSGFVMRPGEIIFERQLNEKTGTFILIAGEVLNQLITMPPESPPTDKKRCQNCGSPFTGEPVFCGKCGSRLAPVSVQQLSTKSTSQQLGMTILPYAMFRSNPQHTGEYDNGGLVLTNTELWRFETKGAVDSSPAISNGVVYVGSQDGNLYAIDAVTGTEKWRFKTGDKVFSPPAVSNGVVYVGSWDKNLYAIDAVTGTEKWRFKTGNYVSSSPAVSNGVVYVGSMDTNLYAIDAVTGTEKWQFTTGGCVISSPAVSNGIVYAGSYDGNLYAIDAVSGTKKWQFTTGGRVSSSPAVSNGVVYVGSGDHNLYAIDAVSGTEKWQFATGDKSVSSPAVASGVVYVGNFDKNLYAIDAISGTKKWQFTTGGQVDSSPAVSNGVVYVGSMDTNLYAIGTYEAVLQQAGTKITTEIEDNAHTLPAETEQLVPLPENTQSSATPDLEIKLDQATLMLSTWHKVQVPITNTGKAHAFSVILSFSDDFQTRLIKPVTVEAGTTKVVEIGILPKTLGNIPIEVTMNYKDEKDHGYTKTCEFWVEVVERGMTTTSGTHTSSASQFTPGTTTLRQVPEDISDRYTETEFIAKGGFARVFKAKRKDGKYVALKLPISMDTSTGKSFIAEMQNWTKLSHPNIVKLYDFNIMPMSFFEEELCDSALSDQKTPIETEEAAWLLFNICEGLKFAHAQKIIHRDLKPQNILLKNGVPKISDWGLSKVISNASSSTNTSFTWYYAAPEQITTRPKDERTDIWQIGVILYELVTGVLPFKGDNPVEIGMSIATTDPQSPGEIRPGAKVIESIVMKCLEKKPENRYQSVIELQKDLALILKMDFKESLKMSIGSNNTRQVAVLTCNLLLTNLKSGDLHEAYKYATDLANYSDGEVRDQVNELSGQIRMRIDNDMDEVPDEIISVADLVAHKIDFGFTTL